MIRAIKLSNLIIKNQCLNNNSSILIKSFYSTKKLDNEKKLVKNKISNFQYNIPDSVNKSNSGTGNKSEGIKKNEKTTQDNPIQNIIFSALDNKNKKPSDSTTNSMINIRQDKDQHEKMVFGIVNSMSAEKLDKFEIQLKENPTKLFEVKQNQIIYFKYLSTKVKHMAFKDMNTWYKLIRKDFTKHLGGEELLKLYNGDHIQACISLFPFFNWHIWKFPTLNKTYWSQDENVVQYLQWLVKKTNRNVNDYESYHYISEMDLIKNHGQHLLSINGGFVCNIFTKYFPQYSNWKPWIFLKYPKDYFKHKENIKKYLLWLGGEILGFKGYEDYYKLKLSDFKNNGGFQIIHKGYSKSCYKLVVDILGSEYTWQPWKFRIIPMKKVNVEILQHYHNHLYSLLNCSTPEELIQLVDIGNPQIINDTNGIDIINEFGASIKSSFEKINSYGEDFEIEEDEDPDNENDILDEFDLNFEIDQKEDHIDEFEKDVLPTTTASTSSKKIKFPSDKLLIPSRKLKSSPFNKRK